MSVSMRPINNDDKRRMAPSEKQVIRLSPMTRLDSAGAMDYNVVSNSIFGKADHSYNDDDSKLKVYEDKYTRVGYIELTKRVLNPFLSGRKAPVWRNILRLDENEIMNIINANVLYDLVDNKEVLLSSVGTTNFDRERYLFGVDYLEYLLDNKDISKTLEDLLVGTFVLPLLTRTELGMYKEKKFNIGNVYKVPDNKLEDLVVGGIHHWLYGNYALDVTNSDFTPERREELDYELLDNAANMDITSLQQFPMLSLLSSMVNENGKDMLKSQILNYMFVLPIGYRPTIDNRVDALTLQYNKLANVNSELRDILDQQNCTCYAVLNKYRELVQLVRNIMIGDDQVIKQQNLKNYKSISDTITGKEGLMRGRMQGARVDYSGRTVITCNPDMPIDCVGIPKKILAKIAEPNIIKGLRHYSPEEGQNTKFNNSNLATFSTTSSKEKNGISYDEYLEKWFTEKDRYACIGRQPTLFYLGIQAFKVIPVDGDAMVLSPLVVMPFNADFDGDQMHVNMPVTQGAIKEVRERMAFSKNIRYPKNGEVTIVTRHEIIYGIWIAHTKRESSNAKNWNDSSIRDLASKIGLSGNYGTMNTVYEAVCKQKMNVYDKVSTGNRTSTAGIIALEYAMFGGKSSTDIENISKLKAKKITSMLMDAYGTSGTSAFLSAINRLVRLGFSVARIWPPNISTIVDSKIEQEVSRMIDEFNDKMIKREELLNIGIEIESEYSTYFNQEWDALKKNVTKYLLDNLDENNGYLTMMKSGGKGDENNILQIFGLKGRVQKNDTTAFNSIISGSYSGQLTGLEHFISAYGSRKGIADKVLATAEPGYLSRKLEHAGSIISVTHEDCGTRTGIEFRVEDIVPFIEESQISRYGVYPKSGSTQTEIDEFYNRTETQTQLLAARDYLANIIVGRWCVEKDGSSTYISDKKEANSFIDRFWGHIDNKEHTYTSTGDGIVRMRSPIYCTKPCCKKCYGYDIAAGTMYPDMGRPIGFIAAQAIGEPGTQLTMKNFQKGGVVTDANLTSSFELIEDYFELHDFSKKKKSKRGVISYDMISPREGYVKEQYLGNGSKRILVTATADPEDRKNLIPGTKKVIVHASTKLKDYVRVGDSFQKIQGNLDMKEVLKYRGYDKAASYLALMLYNTFMTQDVNFKHFETIVAAMSCFYVLAEADNKNGNCAVSYGKDCRFKAGSILTRPELYYATDGNILGVPTIIGLKTLPKYKSDFFESLLMENMDSYIPRAILMNPNDSMSNPITRAAFGLNIGIGSDMSK